MEVCCKFILTFCMYLAKQNFTCVIKCFSVATAFVFYYDAKYLHILQGYSHVFGISTIS